jgi:hypothetical protein
MELDQDTDSSDMDEMSHDDSVELVERQIQFDEKSQLVYGDISNRPIYCGMFNGKSVAVEKLKKNTEVSEAYDSLLHLNHPNIIKVIHADQDRMFKYLFIFSY